jgi:hypothetical protein
MRNVKWLAMICAGLTILLAGTTTASAGKGWFYNGVHHKYAPSGVGYAQPVTRWVYKPNYTYRYKLHSHSDPYRYHYQPRGYYPYYNSGYWRSRRAVHRRYKFRHPRYHRAWGAHRRNYHHRSWHYRHHGPHKKGHW